MVGLRFFRGNINASRIVRAYEQNGDHYLRSFYLRESRLRSSAFLSVGRRSRVSNSKCLSNCELDGVNLTSWTTTGNADSDVKVFLLIAKCKWVSNLGKVGLLPSRYSAAGLSLIVTVPLPLKETCETVAALCVRAVKVSSVSHITSPQLSWEFVRWACSLPAKIFIRAIRPAESLFAQHTLNCFFNDAFRVLSRRRYLRLHYHQETFRVGSKSCLFHITSNHRLAALMTTT